MSHLFPHPLPWYVAGPLIGLMVPALLLLGNKPFGISSNFRHLCAAVAPCGIEFFRHDWRRLGVWNLTFLSGIFAGAAAAWHLAPPPVADAVPADGRGAAAARAARPDRPGAARSVRVGLAPHAQGIRRRSSSAGSSSGSAPRTPVAARRAMPLRAWPTGSRPPSWRCAGSSPAGWRARTWCCRCSSR